MPADNSSARREIDVAASCRNEKRAEGSPALALNHGYIIKDFLIESNENLDRLDQEVVKLESDPTSRELLDSIFRPSTPLKKAVVS